MVAEESNRQGGGIDILQLVAAAKESIEAKPPNNIVVDSETKHKHRKQKKKVLVRKQVLAAKDETIIAQKPTKPPQKDQSKLHVQVHEAAALCSQTGTSLQVAKKDGSSSVMILKRDEAREKSLHATKKKEGKVSALQHELTAVRQELTEVKKRLEQEKSARKISEGNCQRLQNELTSTRQTLEHEMQYRKNCQRETQKHKEKLEHEHILRMAAQDVESNVNDLISTEKKRARDLEKQLQQEQHAKAVITQALETTKTQLMTEKNLRESIQNELAAAQKTNESLQNKIGMDSASIISIRMELNSVKSRMGRVEELEQSLKQEILKVDRLKNELAKAETVKLELEEAKAQLLRVDELKMQLLLERSKVKEAEAKLEDQTWYRKRSDSIQVANNSTSRGRTASSFDDDLDEVDLNVEKLRKELHDTREALKSERKKNAALTAKKSKTAEVSSLKDWIDMALPSSIAEVNMPPATEISLSDGTAQKEAPAQSISEAPIQNESLHYFDGAKNTFCGDDEENPLDDELMFIMSAYSSEEIIISENKDKITRIIDLPTNNDDHVQMNVNVSIPVEYPTNGMLGVDIRISDDTNCSTEVRKCVIDALPKLCQMCQWEAEGNYGQEALFSVLNMADNWAKTTWPGILSKQCPSFKILQRPKLENSNKKSAEIWSALIYTHHLIEPEKIQLVKKIASKLSLGGFIKSGKPGIILITSIAEGDTPDVMLQELSSQASKKVFHSTTFKLAEKTRIQASDLSSSVTLSKITMLENSKEGMDDMIKGCDILGLANALQDIT